jgi:ATP-dependent helicase HrpB
MSREVTQAGALVLGERQARPAPGEGVSAVLEANLRRLGLARLGWTEAARQWQARMALLHRRWPERWPAVDEASLLDKLALWLGPELASATTLAELAAADLLAALRRLVPPGAARDMERLVPRDIEGPSGRRHAIDYGRDPPVMAARLQDLFGLDRHPCILDGEVPLSVELLSPANRPVQATRDLAGFWRGSYAAVRKELRGRYPKHPWPENPWEAQPTARTKRRT